MSNLLRLGLLPLALLCAPAYALYAGPQGEGDTSIIEDTRESPDARTRGGGLKRLMHPPLQIPGNALEEALNSPPPPALPDPVCKPGDELKPDIAGLARA
jgi:hypothetical protein